MLRTTLHNGVFCRTAFINRIRSLLLPIAVLAACLVFPVSIANAQSDQPSELPGTQELQQPPALNGAAAYYKEALDLFNQKFTFKEQWSLGCFPREAGALPTDEEKRLFNRFTPILAKIRQGSNCAQFDPSGSSSSSEITMTQSFNMVRHVASYVRTDVPFRCITGDDRAATSDIVMQLNMARQMTQCHMTQGSSLAFGFLSMADREIHESLIKAGMFTPENASSILEVLNRFDQTDPFKVKTIIEPDRLAVDDYFRHALNQPNWNATQAYIRSDNGPAYDDQSASDLREGVTKFDQIMQSIREAFSLQDQDQARARLDEITKDVSSGKYGKIAMYNACQYANMYGGMLKAEQTLNDLRDLLNKVITGQIDLSNEANAAWYYIRASQLMECNLTPDEHKLIDGFSFEADLPQTDIPSLTKDLQPIIDLILKGSRIRNCDFQFGGQQYRNTLAPAYLSGMGRCFRIMLLNAQMNLDARNPDAAMDCISTILRVVNHLSHDRILLCTDVSEHALDDDLVMFHRIATIPDVASNLKLATIATLTSAIETLAKETAGDPFGFNAAMTELRTVVKSMHFLELDADGHTRIADDGTQNPIAKPDPAFPEVMINTATPDRLIQMVLIYDIHNYRGDSPDGYNYQYDTLVQQMHQLRPPLDTLRNQWDVCTMQRPAIDEAIANHTLEADWIDNHTFRYGLNEDAARAQEVLAAGKHEIEQFIAVQSRK